MKTLVIISHPDILESRSQQFFLNAIKGLEEITIHHLEEAYPDGKIDIAFEQSLLREHQRVIFQFPFYWYSSPALLKHWQDVVLTDEFAFGSRGEALVGKEFGLVLIIGVKESEYQAGGTEQFSINELTKPFQAMAHKTGMTYLKPFNIFQFSFMNEDQKMDMLIHYLQMLTMENNQSLASREKWLIDQLERITQTMPDTSNKETLEHTIALVKENRDTIDDLKFTLDQMW